MRTIKPLTWKGDGLRIHGRRRLPHFRLNHRAYFITTRLNDSVPRYVQEKLDSMKLRLYEQHRDDLKNPVRLRDLQAEIARAWESELDRSYGCCELRDPANARLVEQALEFWDGRKYALICYSIMPNHVHVVAFFDDADLIPAVIGSWKGYTTHAINARMGREGRLWQPEYFDRTIRGEEELAMIRDYVMNNAALVGLKDWEFQRYDPEWTSKLEAMRK